jgi:ribosomal protein S17
MTKKIEQKKEIKIKGKKFKGTVVKPYSDTHKFLSVVVVNYVPHPLYRKLIKKSKKYLVSCVGDEGINIRDKILFVSVKPISKKIRFKYISKL